MSILFLTYLLPFLPNILHVTATSCQPYHTTFPSSSVSGSDSHSYSPFVAISPPSSYKAGDKGLQLFLDKPKGAIKTKDGVNDKVAEGATVNSTFTLLYGKVVFEVTAPVVAGVVTAVILIADGRDEIDVELLGGEPSYWQTNIFAPTHQDSSPMYGVFSSKEDIPKNEDGQASIEEVHKYGIEWNEERIKWSVDEKVVRTLNREDTRRDGSIHYPSHAARIQMGIWDGSNPAGTSEWAKGPINWKKAPERIVAIVRSVRVECP